MAEKNELEIVITARDEASRQIAAATQNVRVELQTLERATQQGDSAVGKVWEP